MSYDVHVVPFRGGEVVPVESPAAWGLLEAAWEDPPDEHGFCRVRRDGDEGDVYGLGIGKPMDGLMFNHAGPGVYALMFDVAAAADMVIVPPDCGPFLVREGQRTDLPAELSDGATVVTSGADLVRAIGDG